METPPPQAPPRATRAQWARTERRFAYYVRQTPYLTVALIALFIFFHLLTGAFDALSGRAPLWAVIFGDRSTDALIRYGGRYAPAVAHGELWRLITCGFLHANLLHILFNSSALWSLGAVAESVFGRARLLWIFLLSVLGGAALAQWGPSVLPVWQASRLSIGASGGVFGVGGALAVFGLRHKASLPPPMQEWFGMGLWRMIGINLFIGFVIPFIDNLGHIGGLLAGITLGALLRPRLLDEHPSPTRDTVLGVGAGLVAALSFGALLLKLFR